VSGLPRNDTIAAIATPSGRGGIGIVRISGIALAQWGAALVGRPLAPRRASRVSFLDARGQVIDDGLALFFPAPSSYTGEDVLELHGHGGPVVTRMLLARSLELGARLAEPGEFTRRAFLNDKLDLAQAEAVADVIDASTESAVRCAMRSLKGEFSERVHQLRTELIELRMLVEATLDFPEEEVDALDRADARARLARLRESVDRALVQGRQGSILRSGLHVVLAGQPNVGKSRLLNRLVGEDIAIVTPIAGTTRDTIRQAIQLEGVPVNIVDTAGLHESNDVIERIGMDRTWAEIGKADVLLQIVDARSGVAPADTEILARLPARLRHLVVHNKIDLVPSAPRRWEDNDAIHIAVSALTGAGIELLRGELLAVVGWHPGSEDIFMARERHLQALERTTSHLQAAAELTTRVELFAEELRIAQERLAEITGEFTADDLLGEIFARFCIGK
jgi:tRNA modification GTPase